MTLSFSQSIKYNTYKFETICIFYQVHIIAVVPILSLEFSPLSSEEQCSKSSCTIFVSPLSHASTILPSTIWSKHFQPRISKYLCKTSRHLIDPRVSKLQRYYFGEAIFQSMTFLRYFDVFQLFMCFNLSCYPTQLYTRHVD